MTKDAKVSNIISLNNKYSWAINIDTIKNL